MLRDTKLIVNGLALTAGGTLFLLARHGDKMPSSVLLLVTTVGILATLGLLTIPITIAGRIFSEMRELNPRFESENNSYNSGPLIV